MQLIVGLGNPGSQYLLTRHNIGFLVIDGLAQNFGAPVFKKEHKAETTKVRIGSTPVLLAKPQTFMNLSGESVRALMDYYEVAIDQILIVHDEVDLPYEALRFQSARGAGGHNGIKSVHQHLGTNEYCRLKVGVSRPSNPRQNVADFVLQNFSNEEQQTLPDYISQACDATICFIENGWKEAANRYNGNLKGS